MESGSRVCIHVSESTSTTTGAPHLATDEACLSPSDRYRRNKSRLAMPVSACMYFGPSWTRSSWPILDLYSAGGTRLCAVSRPIDLLWLALSRITDLLHFNRLLPPLFFAQLFCPAKENTGLAREDVIPNRYDRQPRTRTHDLVPTPDGLLSFRPKCTECGRVPKTRRQRSRAGLDGACVADFE